MNATDSDEGGCTRAELPVMCNLGTAVQNGMKFQIINVMPSDAPTFG